MGRSHSHKKIGPSHRAHVATTKRRTQERQAEEALELRDGPRHRAGRQVRERQEAAQIHATKETL